MKRIFLILVCLFSAVLQAEQAYSVLYISSYDSSFPTYPLQSEGLNDVFSQSDYTIEMHTEFLDSKRYSYEEMKRILYGKLSFKTRITGSYDYVITADDNALIFALEYQEELFPGIPIVFFGVNNQDLARQQNSNPHVTGFPEKISFKETVDLIKTLIPDLRNIHIIYDETSSGSADFFAAREYQRQIRSIPLEYISLGNLSFDEFAAELENLQPDQPLILLSAYRDRLDRTLSFNESVKLISSHSNAPVFHLWRHGIGKGLLGGYVVDHRFYAELSARLVLDLIQGADIAGIPVSEVSRNRPLIDYRVLQKFNLDRRRLPEETVLLNHAPLIDEKSLSIIIILLAIILALTALILVILRYQKLLKSTEKRYRALFNENRVPIIITDPRNSSILSCNEAAEELYRVSRYRSLEEMNLDNHPVINYDRGDKSYTVMTFCDASEQLRSVEVISNEFEQETVSYQINMIHDISDKEDLLNQLNRAVKMEAIGKVASSFAHDFNNYLQGIIGYMELVLQNLDPGDEKIRGYMNKSLSLAASSSELAGKLLSISRQKEMVFAPVNVNHILKDVVDFLSHSVRKTIPVVFSTPEVEYFAHGNEGDLQNALINLGLNAADAIDERGTIEYRVKSDPVSDKVEIDIIDTGKGIPEGDLNRIFDPFYTTKPKGEGTGLGLPTVYQIIEQHRGDVQVLSKVGEGTTFRIFLPAMKN